MSTRYVPLWDLPRPGRPCPFADDPQPFDSWQALRDNADRHDNRMNVVIWWDWYPPNDAVPHDELILYVALPNHEGVYPWTAPVSREQEPEIREWLRGRLQRLIGYWQVGI